MPLFPKIRYLPDFTIIAIIRQVTIPMKVTLLQYRGVSFLRRRRRISLEFKNKIKKELNFKKSSRKEKKKRRGRICSKKKFTNHRICQSQISQSNNRFAKRNRLLNLKET